MRVNTSLLVAALALFSSQCLVAAEHSAEPSGLYNTDSDIAVTSSSKGKLSGPPTDDAMDGVDADAIRKANREILDKALGSAANGDDAAKIKALNSMSEDDLINILMAMTLPKSSNSIYDDDVDDDEPLWTEKHPKPRVPVVTDETEDTFDWKHGNFDDNSGASEDELDFAASPARKTWVTENDPTDTVQGDTDTDLAGPKARLSKYDDELVLGAGAGAGAGLYTATKDKRGNDADDSLYLSSASALGDSIFSGSLEDETLATKKYLYGIDPDLDGSSDDDIFAVPTKKGIPTLAAHSGGKSDVTNPLDDLSEKELDELLKQLDSSGSGMPPSLSKDEDTNEPAVDAVMMANKNKLDAALGPDVLAGGNIGIMSALSKMDQKELDELLESFSTSGSDDMSDDEVPYEDLMKGKKKAYVTPQSALDLGAASEESMVDMEGVDDLDDSNSKSESEPETAASPENKKPCRVSWWRTLAFWNDEHKCSESRRLRTDLV